MDWHDRTDHDILALDPADLPQSMVDQLESMLDTEQMIADRTMLFNSATPHTVPQALEDGQTTHITFQNTPSNNVTIDAANNDDENDQQSLDQFIESLYDFHRVNIITIVPPTWFDGTAITNMESQLFWHLQQYLLAVAAYGMSEALMLSTLQSIFWHQFSDRPDHGLIVRIMVVFLSLAKQLPPASRQIKWLAQLLSRMIEHPLSDSGVYHLNHNRNLDFECREWIVQHQIVDSLVEAWVDFAGLSPLAHHILNGIPPLPDYWYHQEPAFSYRSRQHPAPWQLVFHSPTQWTSLNAFLATVFSMLPTRRHGLLTKLGNLGAHAVAMPFEYPLRADQVEDLIMPFICWFGFGGGEFALHSLYNDDLFWRRLHDPICDPHYRIRSRLKSWLWRLRSLERDPQAGELLRHRVGIARRLFSRRMRALAADLNADLVQSRENYLRNEEV